MGISFMNDDYAIMHSNLCYAIGAQVPRFEGANRALGSLILRFKDVEAMMRLLNEPEQWMTLHIMSNDVKEEESWKSSSPVRTAF